MRLSIGREENYGDGVTRHVIETGEYLSVVVTGFDEGSRTRRFEVIVNDDELVVRMSSNLGEPPLLKVPLP